MRIHLKFKISNQTVPFDHQPLLVGAIHKWLGQNEEHGEISLYSFSRLEGGKATNEGIKFNQDGLFFFSSINIDLVKRLISGIRSDPSMFFGLRVNELFIEEDPDLSNRELFFPGSPIFIKRRNGERIEQIFFDDPRSSEYLRETLLTKMGKVGLEDDSLDIRFDLSHTKSGTKMITYKGIKNKANWCPVIIKGKPETKLFAWNVGLGNSTGIGFGAIK
ncbi:MAG: CRISPR-associated endoribonuclease Cas6 [Bacteroidales bacterium]|jgi:CRISPR-associated endoribonuclease Cas6|nr:CRISPR-associated endoribonuclease Cas6 [Bacteroidales bacterium]HOH23700.1 CRISPR-associated endoribonuclease Cas6 [Bacteroidales bacterium]HPY58688.1 CRISPR-associated endoribonuclease Cas6 [Bacteroidales bacterium]HQB70966.1 CRISPR-associated endoribonuclease Cas6 [Bacteroidales bacterium]HQN87853.1 CRISPR-associated endoribonuclease Cas6 [Bacteroidales bacterium]